MIVVAVHLLAFAGVLHALQEIAGPALLRWTRWRWVGALASCSYCAGFHAGWMTWVLAQHAPAILYAFAGAGLGLVVSWMR